MASKNVAKQTFNSTCIQKPGWYNVITIQKAYKCTLEVMLLNFKNLILQNVNLLACQPTVRPTSTRHMVDFNKKLTFVIVGYEQNTVIMNPRFQ